MEKIQKPSNSEMEEEFSHQFLGFHANAVAVRHPIT
jgi:hypothetical protein